MTEPDITDFRKELENLINKHSKENGSDTPDFILADYLADCLAAFDRAVKARTHWYRPDDPSAGSGLDPDPGVDVKADKIRESIVRRYKALPDECKDPKPTPLGRCNICGRPIKIGVFHEKPHKPKRNRRSS